MISANLSQAKVQEKSQSSGIESMHTTTVERDIASDILGLCKSIQNFYWTLFTFELMTQLHFKSEFEYDFQ